MCNCQENEDQNKSNLIIVYFNVSVQRIYKIFRYQNVLDFMSVSDRKLSNVFKNRPLKRSIISDM
jgi:hypothetical protein